MLPPVSDEELLTRAHAIAGKTLAILAASAGVRTPHDLIHAKGWIGQLLEKVLGASAINLDQPDFTLLNIELKTIPITIDGKILESTYICKVSLPFTETEWQHSRVWRKMSKILFVPIEANNQKHLIDQRIGMPLLWTPDAAAESVLQQDWLELSEMIRLGQFDRLTAHHGQVLQIRPKAPNSRTFVKAMNDAGEMVDIIPKGFYLRRQFTQQLFDAHFALA